MVTIMKVAVAGLQGALNAADDGGVDQLDEMGDKLLVETGEEGSGRDRGDAGKEAWILKRLLCSKTRMMFVVSRMQLVVGQGLRAYLNLMVSIRQL